MTEHIVFMQAFGLVIIGSALSVLGSASIWYLKTKGDCMKAMKKNISKVDRRSWRIGKAVILISQMIDSQTGISHPEAKSALERLAKEMIEDEPTD